MVDEALFQVSFCFLDSFEFCFLSFISIFVPFASSESNGARVEKMKFGVSFMEEMKFSSFV